MIEIFSVGLITAGICNLALAASMAEFLSAYPTAGGQYHWVAVISWPKWVPLLSWITGWINVSGWIALTASGGLLGSQFVVGVISLYNPVGLTLGFPDNADRLSRRMSIRDIRFSLYTLDTTWLAS